MDAKGRIETVKSVKDGLKIVASLVSLAGALASGDVKLVVKTREAVGELI